MICALGLTIGHQTKDRYKGEWKKDLQHGQGTYTYANGDEYVGEYRNVMVRALTYKIGDKCIGYTKRT